jgi:hypothetical protein
MRIIIIMVLTVMLVGCTSDSTLILKDRLNPDTYYLDLRPNTTSHKGEGLVTKYLNTTGVTENLTFYEDVRE